MSELIQQFLDKRSCLADVGRPKPESQPVKTEVTNVLIPDEAYLLRDYANSLSTMEVDCKELDFGGQNEGDLFTFVPKFDLAERR